MKKIVPFSVFLLILYFSVATNASEIIKESKRIGYQGEKEVFVKIKFGAGKVKIEKGSSNQLLDAKFEYSSDDFKPVIEHEYDEKAKKSHILLSLERDKRDEELEVETEDEDFNWKVEENEWVLRFSDKVPINFDIQIGAAEGDFDMTNLKVSDMFMDTGAGNVSVNFGEPNKVELERLDVNAGVTKLRMENLMNANFSQLDFDGGVGQFTLDFNGEMSRRSYADISLGVGQMTLLIPESLGTEIKSQSFFLSPLSIDEFNKIKKGLYQNDSFNTSKKELYVDIKGGLGSLNVETIEGK